MRQANVNGKGAVFQVSDTKWVAKVCLGVDDNGKPIIKQFSGKTEAIAKKKLRDFKKSTDYVEKHIPSTDTVRAYFTAWMKEYQFHKLKPSSYDRLESTVVNHIFPHLGNMKVDKVTRNHVQGLVNQLYSEKNLSYSSIKKVYVALNACYKHALIEGTVLRNPCVGISLPSASERTKEVVALSEKEVEQLRTAIMNANTSCTYAHAYLLILNTGMRMGEALSLKWEDVDFSNKTITITKNNILSKKRDENGERLGGYELRTQDSTKTASGNRTIPLNRSAEAALLELKKGNHTPHVIVNSRQHISENILCLIVDYNLQKKFKGNGTNIIFDINQILPDFPCIMLTNYPEPSKNEKIVSRRLIWDRDRMSAQDLGSVVDEIKNEVDVFLQRKQILFSQYEELLEKRQHDTMSAMEEERFLQLHSLFSKYGETDDIPTQLMTADADKKLDSIIEKLSKLVDRKED